MITILDYGMGNLHSVKNALDHLGVPAEISASPDAVERAQALILPGVGAFPDAVTALRQKGWLTAIPRAVRNGTPLLGVCLGMQLLFSESEEFGRTPGLDLIPGRVVPLRAQGLKIPHIGWNSLQIQCDDPLLCGVKPGAYVYFVHSFRADTASENTLCTTDYGAPFPSLVRNPALPVWGAQFHPEKSHDTGLQMLRNFCTAATKGAAQ